VQATRENISDQSLPASAADAFAGFPRALSSTLSAAVRAATGASFARF
jgi:hypothetical protein